jgi:transposase InsO family protein
LSDNGSSYISADLAKWLDGQNIDHIRGAPYCPMTQGRIERWHQTLKNRILLWLSANSRYGDNRRNGIVGAGGPPPLGHVRWARTRPRTR